MSNSHVNFGNVLWVAFSIPPGSLSLVKYLVYFLGQSKKLVFKILVYNLPYYFERDCLNPLTNNEVIG
jgi:hypothetical protein